MRVERCGVWSMASELCGAAHVWVILGWYLDVTGGMI
jgi:hypothetical protein